jgi:DNA polymerase delta subunit 3
MKVQNALAFQKPAANNFQDLALLVDAADEVFRMDEKEDFAKPNVVVNPKLRRKERTRPAPKPVNAAPFKPVRQEVKPEFSAASKPTPAAPKAKEAPQPAQSVAASAASKKPPALKRGGSSNSGIMAAFSKAATQVKKDASASNSRAATPSGDDVSMHPMSDDGEDDAEVPQPKPREIAGRKSKREREEELRRMMDEDDEEEEEPEKAPTPEEEPIEEPAPEPEKEEPSEVVTISNGRRRGKRRIMRKKQVMDEQGYLGTFNFCEPLVPRLTQKSHHSGAGMGVLFGG